MTFTFKPFAARMPLALAIALPGLVQAAQTEEDPILTRWKVYYNRTGTLQSIVEFVKEDDGTISGYVRKLNTADPRVVTVCTLCPAPFTNKPVLNMRVIWGLKPETNHPGNYTSGYAMDPANGKIYKGKGRISSDGRRLWMRGYIGISMLGRTEVWLRDEGNSEKE